MLPSLTSLEAATLIAVVRLEGEAYGLAVQIDLESFAAQPIAPSAVYEALARLEKRKLLASVASAPLAVQGGRSKRLYELTPHGVTQLKLEHLETTRMWQALPSRFKFTAPRGRGPTRTQR